MMFGRTNRQSSISASSYRHAKDVVFLGRRDTVFCTVCELISYNNSPRCHSCGSMAVLSLSRVLGGSLRHEDCARVVNSVDTGEVLPARKAPQPETLAWPPQFGPEYAVAMQAHAMVKSDQPVSVLNFGIERPCALTDAIGGAV